MIFDAIHSKVNILDNVEKNKDKKFIILITMVWFF